MYQVITSSQFDEWLTSLDKHARGRIIARLDKAERGLLGDTKPVGNGISEMREHFGPGYRLYYKIHGKIILVVLAGGDKSTQPKDIAQAVKIAKEYRK
ncbi:type II toxin-antitoxin system RelE/ParE family toxin [Dyella mobilis]|uniref:Type II toxin-antitoxin system RelE/ParE family toxin n=1 Tax=Dyella mobilis TaxID=1849582 RepID=A0ABS2KJB2_9GAMM|nr:type II toxin-antitoxin system RelE/ParE family toxin [Dyella mobilis]MBM7131221.1 type II toxin-antitoxin system RelE/ParE family toxin [Dyella mobilis]GLQ98842.1 addiction module antitoxin RelB [Dyella mobilis]